MLILEAAIATALSVPSTESVKLMQVPTPSRSVATAPAHPRTQAAPSTKSAAKPKPQILKVPITPAAKPSVGTSPMPKPSGCNWAGC